MRTFSLVMIAVGFALGTTLVRADEAVDRAIAEGLAQAERGEHSAAIDLFDRAIKMDPKAAEAYYHRGRSLFCFGKAKAAVADFDRYVQLDPKAESRQWERGIAMYYAGGIL